jgi:hypothetical protein
MRWWWILMVRGGVSVQRISSVPMLKRCSIGLGLEGTGSPGRVATQRRATSRL